METKISEDEMAKLIAEKEVQSGMNFDENKTPEVKVETQEIISEISLGKSEEWKLQNERQSDTVFVENGWKPFPVEMLPSQGRFYPEGTTINLRSALVSEIRHFSTLDENDPLDLDDKLNMVVDKCLQIKMGDRIGSWKDLKEEDRFNLVFAIRDITFANGENKLFINVKCGQTCNGDGNYNEKVELTKDTFEYYDIDPKLMKYYSNTEKCFVIPSTEVGTIKLYIPSLGVTTFIKNYIREKNRKGEFYDKTFLKIASFMFGDWRSLNEKAYKAAEQNSFGWNNKKLSAMLKLVEMVRFGVKTRITRECKSCGVQITTPLSFPGGIKSLFLYDDPLANIL